MKKIITDKELKRLKKNRICLYCGQKVHVLTQMGFCLFCAAKMEEEIEFGKQ